MDGEFGVLIVYLLLPYFVATIIHSIACLEAVCAQKFSVKTVAVYLFLLSLFCCLHTGAVRGRQEYAVVCTI